MNLLRPLRRFAPAAALVTASLIAAAPASAACAKTSTLKAFSAFGDSADYSPLSGGSFEGSTSGWTLSSGAVTAGSNTTAIAGVRGSRSLLVPAGAKVVSPVFCVGVEHPAWRFFAKQVSGSWAVLNVKVRFTDSVGVNETTVGSLSANDFKTWQPSRSIALATALGLWQAGSSYTAQLVFQPETGGGGWQIDDVYIDPYRRS